eukprot:s3101_g5.t1
MRQWRRGFPCLEIALSSGGASRRLRASELSRAVRRCLEIEIQCIARWSHGCCLEALLLQGKSIPAGYEPNVSLFAVRWHRVREGHDQWSQIHSGQTDNVLNTNYKIYVQLTYQSGLRTKIYHQYQQRNGKLV